MKLFRRRRHESVPSKAVRAQAAAWLAQLHDEHRTPHIELRVAHWLAEREDHRHAFNRMSRAWELAAAVKMPPAELPEDTPVRWTTSLPRATAIAAALVLVVLFGISRYLDNAVETGVGQRQVRILKDGTRVLLNTDTRIEVTYDDQTRRVRLIHGEAQFDVAKNPNWPFLVSVDGQVIRALGTSFIVRHDDIQDLSITLVEGRISVTPITEPESPTPDAQILLPGQRLVISTNRTPTVDRPEINRLTAWERGQVEFGDTTLADAAREMNRYSKTHVIIADPDIAKRRIGGIFTAGHTDEFVSFVTATFGVRAEHEAGDVVLNAPGHSANPPQP
jgi:transmembrane sensor